jgi:tetraacyldisaccharide 4'-kinase
LKRVFLFFERVLFSPKPIHFPLILILLPFSIIFIIFTFLNAFRKHLIAQKFEVPIIGVGNLVLGGTGKTPVTIALAKMSDEVAIVLRGYRRKSKGTIVVSKFGEILVDVATSGDEAMLYAHSLPNAIVVVSEDRAKGIELAIEFGANKVFLDDSYRQHHIYKDIEFILDSNTKNPLPFPAGAYREKIWFFKKNIVLLKEGVDFERKVWVETPRKYMVLITAISKPYRLNKYIDPKIPKYYFPDHHVFTVKEIEDILKENKTKNILTTEKDLVKLPKPKINISILKLQIEFSNEFKTTYL